MRGTMRLFTGLPVPAERADELLRLARRVATPGLRWTPPENLHVTLYFLGEVGEPRLPDLKLALERVECAAFSVQASGLGSFPRSGVLFAAVEKTTALERLQAAVAAQVACFAARPDPNSPPLGAYHPHITLGRTRERLRIDSAKLPKVAASVRFEAERVNLYQSRPGPGGSLYEVLHTQLLQQDPARRDILSSRPGVS